MYENAIFISIPRYKNADASKTQVVSHVIYNFLDLFCLWYNYVKFHHCGIFQDLNFSFGFKF